ncbi:MULTISPECIES: hypothetical protein [Listeria]|uniref:hypothetical protein n=1 Tax=Listeria TaxID=1637 RepID=UPI000B59846E|nr:MULTISPECIES: hypothetical protein [Listeria]
MKKLVLTGAIIMLFVALVGCSDAADTKKSSEKLEKKTVEKVDPKETYGFKDIVDVNGLRIEFTKAQSLESDGKANSVLKLSFDLSNPTADKKGFTAINLMVKNKEGEQLDVYPGENYGKEIEPGNSDKGAGYFKVKGNGPFTVKYTDPDNEKLVATWKLEVEK